MCTVSITIRVSTTEPLTLSENFKKCSQKDIACLKDAIEDALPKFKNGIPELDVPPLDPLFLGNVTIGGGSQVVRIEQKYLNAHLCGLSDSKIHNLIFDLDKGKIGLNFTAPVVNLNASYIANGKILALPIYGHGECSITQGGFNGNIVMDINIQTRSKEKYLRVSKYSFQIVFDYMVFNLENLFDGNMLLTENVNRVLTDNWQPIYDEVIADYARLYGDRLTELVNKFFEKVSISEMFLD